MNRRSFLYGSAALGVARPSLARPGQRHSSGESRRSRALHAAAFLEHGILAQAFLDMDDRERVILMAKSAIVEKPRTGAWRPSAVAPPTPPWAAPRIGAPRS